MILSKAEVLRCLKRKKARKTVRQITKVVTAILKKPDGRRYRITTTIKIKI